MCGCFSPAPWGEPALKPRHVPWVGIELESLWFTGQHSSHWAMPAGAAFFFLAEFLPLASFLEVSPHCLYVWILPLPFLMFYLFMFRETGRESSMCGCLSHGHNCGPGLQPRMCPECESNWWLFGSELALKSTVLTPARSPFFFYIYFLSHHPQIFSVIWKSEREKFQSLASFRLILGIGMAAIWCLWWHSWVNTCLT